ncbi:phosphotransferase [Streptomyces sp. FH025]|uniref:phosphotransferase n=1 Tax=Streptomyces sp. FH025 TaxID=2815937 RepID=UPI001A9E660A|nr:phosphotransferase [Streptomyces sp. FH025]MBO1413660.1 phosphotransferase [Streptomyces sp. FH025]
MKDGEEHVGMWTVVRVGDTVRRQPGPWTPAVHRLLDHFERVGFGGAPRAFGLDAEGREVLEYVEGHVPAGTEVADVTDDAVFAVGRLMRRMHEAAEGFSPEPAGWAHPPATSGPGTVVCHNDIAPRNTVFAGGLPVAFIDWEAAGRELPEWDLAQAAWQFAPLTDERGCAALGWRTPPERGHRFRLLVDGYGLAPERRADLAGFAAARIRFTLDLIRRRAAEGVPGFVRLVESGIADGIERDALWTEAHRDELTAALLGDDAPAVSRAEEAERAGTVETADLPA